MKITRCIMLLLVMGSIGFLSLAEGVDDRGVANSPFTNERANACYDGGSMAGKCETELAWVCGWYAIRLETGVIAPQAAPDECVVRAQAGGVVYPVANCIAVGQTALGNIYYMDFLNGNDAPVGSPVYLSSDCVAFSHSSTTDVVYAPDGDAVADILCALHFGKIAFPLHYNFVYTCN